MRADNYFKLTVRYSNASEQPSQVRGIHPRRRLNWAEDGIGLTQAESAEAERVVSYCYPFSSESAYQLQQAYSKALDRMFALGKTRCKITVWDADAIEHHKLVSAPQIGSMLTPLQDSGSVN